MVFFLYILFSIIDLDMTGGCEYLNIAINKQQKVDFS
jgi:hypothetical protein